MVNMLVILFIIFSYLLTDFLWPTKVAIVTKIILCAATVYLGASFLILKSENNFFDGAFFTAVAVILILQVLWYFVKKRDVSSEPNQPIK